MRFSTSATTAARRFWRARTKASQCAMPMPRRTSGKQDFRACCRKLRRHLSCRHGLPTHSHPKNMVGVHAETDQVLPALRHQALAPPVRTIPRRDAEPIAVLAPCAHRRICASAGEGRAYVRYPNGTSVPGNLRGENCRAVPQRCATTRLQSHPRREHHGTGPLMAAIRDSQHLTEAPPCMPVGQAFPDYQDP